MNHLGGGGLVNTQPDTYLPRTDGPDFRFKTSGQIVDENENPVGIDASTRALEVIDYAHHEIHSGSHFYIQGYLVLASGASAYSKLVTPDTGKWVHFIFNIRSSGITTTYLDEDAVGATGGTVMTPINNNRNSSSASALVFTAGVTNATSYTTRLENDKWGAEGFKEVTGGGSGRDDELVLKQNTTYLRTFISESDDNIIQFKASWYEHEDKG